MPIAVIGAGAIGGAVAAALTRAGRDVVLVARGQRLEALQSAPLLIESGRSRHEVAVRAVAADALTGPVDLAICCVKTLDLEAALAPLPRALGAGGAVVMLQNGVEAHEVAARRLPNASILAGRIHGFFEADGPVIRHVGVPPSILMGRTYGDPMIEGQVLEIFAGSDIPASVAPDILVALWEKFLLSAGLGGVASALDIPAGSVLASPEGANLLRAAMAEILMLAQHRGIGLTQDHVAAALEFVASFPPDATTSLQRDIAAGRPSEYDALTGAVPRLARQSGVALEVFPRLAEMIAARTPTAL